MVKKMYYWTIIPSLIDFMVTQQLAEIKAESGFGYCKKEKSFRKTTRRRTERKRYYMKTGDNDRNYVQKRARIPKITGYYEY